MSPVPNPRQSRFAPPAAPSGRRGPLPKGTAKGAAGAILLPGALFLGYEAASKGDFKGLSEGAAIRKKILKDQMAARTAPAHSALVRQKGQAGQNLKPWLEQAQKARSGAKANASQDLGKAKQAVAPLKQAAGQKAAAVKKVAGADKKAAIKALAPTRSALVRQKAQTGQNLQPWLGRAKKVGSGAKANASQDLGKAKQAMAPLKQVAGEKAAAAKKVASADKKAAIKALTPARSALVRQKDVAGRRLKPVKSTMVEDLKGIRKDMSGAKDAAKQSRAASDLKKAGASTNQGITKVSDRIGRWLAGGKQG